MSTDPRTAKGIFIELVSNVPPEEWENRLEESCQGNEELRDHLRALLRAHGQAGSFLEQPAVAANAAILHEPAISEGPGTLIGPYKLLEQIGEGGMGVVFMAEQTKPIQRTVALKIIKPGMDTRQVIARFEAERQALAMMDHPNIARVIDAGTTTIPPSPSGRGAGGEGAPDLASPAHSGRPYFVMELVKGVPITDYCDRERLPVRQRLELMSQVCHAVQHAHQKGVIHRDLKPSNVLVAEYDGQAVPKIIDFGVAKATAQRLTERTMFTQYGQIVGTFEYMSPEQARFNQLDVDTRSDVYSLGVLLYELLTGTTPLEKERLRSAAFDEILRIISDEEPPKPSTRLSSLLSSSGSLPLAGRAREGVSAASIAANRQTEPARLSRDMRGELDWIVMKALEKDRNRRFESASGLAADIERYLNDEQVLACPPSTAYRLRKLVRRHRLAVIAALTFVAVLMALVAGLTVTNRIITKSRNETAAALRLKEQALQEAQAERQRAEENFVKVRLAVQDLLFWPAAGRGDLPEPVRTKLVEVANKFYSGLGDERSTNPSLRYDAAVGQRSLGFLSKQTGDLKRSEELLRRSISTLQALHQEHPDRPEYRQQLGWSHYMLSETLEAGQRADEALVAAEQAREIYERLIDEHPQVTDYPAEVWSVYSSLASMHAAAGRMEDAAEMLDRKVKVNADHYSWYEAAGFYLFIGDVERYRGACREMLDRFEKRAEEQPLIAERTVKTCALASDSVPDFARVDRLAERCLAGTETDVNRGYFVIAKGLADYRAGRYEAAVERLHATGASSSDAIPLACRAMAHHRLGQHDDARAALESARALLAKESSHSRRTSVELMQAEILTREAAELLDIQESQPPPDPQPKKN